MPMQCLVVPVLFRRCYVWHAMNWCRLQSLKIIYSVLQQTLHHKTSFPEHFSRKCRYGITAARSYGGLSIFACVNDLVAAHGADSLLVGALLAVVRVHLVHLKKKNNLKFVTENYTHPKIKKIQCDSWTDVLPSACKFCTFWSPSRLDWNDFSSMSVACSPLPA